ncbi:MAG: hypothetical protein QOE59_835 [Actinomycetota bacterium]|jgi:hypothetical protein|nr:hypothetical protein [Actinomycetota bacterium]
MSALTGAGFSPADTGAASPRPSTTIAYAPTDQADATAARVALAPGTVLSPDNQLVAGQLHITVGTDRPAVTATATTASPARHPRSPPPPFPASTESLDSTSP